MRILRPFTRIISTQLIEPWEAGIFSLSVLSRLKPTADNYSAIINASISGRVDVFLHIFEKLYPISGRTSFTIIHEAKKRLAQIRDDNIIRDCFDHALQHDNVRMAMFMRDIVSNLDLDYLELVVSYKSLRCAHLIIKWIRPVLYQTTIRRHVNENAGTIAYLPMIKLLDYHKLLLSQVVFYNAIHTTRIDATMLPAVRKVVAYLVSQYPDEITDTAEAVELCDHAIIKMLLPLIIHSSANREAIANRAVEQEKISVLQLLFSYGGMKYGYSSVQCAMIHAIRINKVKIMSFLRREFGANPVSVADAPAHNLVALRKK